MELTTLREGLFFFCSTFFLVAALERERDLVVGKIGMLRESHCFVLAWK